jgi:excisionase family DNA binding protein
MSDGGIDTEPKFYTAGEVAQILRIAQPTVYEISRKKPARLGAVRWGRSVRFSRAVIDRIAQDASWAAESGRCGGEGV